MDLVWIVYVIDTLLGVLSGLDFFVFLFLLIGGVITFFRFIIAVGGEQNNETEVNEVLGSAKQYLCKPYVWGTLILFMALAKLTPDKETAYKMLAAYGATELIQMEETQQIGSKAYKALDKILSDYIGEDEVIPDK